MFCSHPEHSLLNEKYENIKNLFSQLNLFVHSEVDWLTLFNNTINDYLLKIDAIVKSIPQALINTDCGKNLIDLIEVETDKINTAAMFPKIWWHGRYVE